MEELDNILGEYGIYINKNRDHKALDKFIEEKIGRTPLAGRGYRDEEANLILSMYFKYWADWRIEDGEDFARIFGFDEKEKEIPGWYFDYFSLTCKGDEIVMLGIKTTDRYMLEKKSLEDVNRRNTTLHSTKKKYELLSVFSVKNAEKVVREAVVKKILTIAKEYEESPVTKEMTKKILKLVEREYKRILAQYS